MKKPPLKCQAIMRKRDTVNISDDDDHGPTVKRARAFELKSVILDPPKNENNKHAEMLDKYMNEGNNILVLAFRFHLMTCFTLAKNQLLEESPHANVEHMHTVLDPPSQDLFGMIDVAKTTINDQAKKYYDSKYHADQKMIRLKNNPAIQPVDINVVASCESMPYKQALVMKELCEATSKAVEARLLFLEGNTMNTLRDYLIEEHSKKMRAV